MTPEREIFFRAGAARSSGVDKHVYTIKVDLALRYHYFTLSQCKPAARSKVSLPVVSFRLAYVFCAPRDLTIASTFVS